MAENDGVPDMTALENLGEESMLENLRVRLLKQSAPYTLVSTVLVAVPPSARPPGRGPRPPLPPLPRSAPYQPPRRL